ncbi:hypothetical protein [Nodularia sp. UHCC 0506]|uniref:hypothetical protein n=1 Tax=Nodularia sp. UHCC 0506 TaxID=3110243 RepID=UPI002B1F414F|nr:hypothetical protein [Nodularia sp. UHCC 0506]MEA5516764.1 hypothetical protein [Nodularia sp. UHCC 0506]
MKLLPLLLVLSAGAIACTPISSPPVVTPVTPVESPVTPAEEETPTIALSEEKKATAFVDAYLTEITTGGDLDQGFFCSFDTVAQFNSPREYKILRTNFSDGKGRAIARVDTRSTSENYFIALKSDRPMWASQIGEVGTYNICIDFISEHRS